MKSELIICTKNRVEELKTCMQSIERQDVIPSRIIIVDASNNDETKVLSKKYCQIFPLMYLKSDPGLARQRNYGVKYLLPDTEIVHFIDDDVILDLHYFLALERVFNNDIGGFIGGAGGYITNNARTKTTIVGRIFLLDSLKKGAVLPSSKPTMVDSNIETDISVDWLPGCSMSYRGKIFQEFQFDSKLQGYSAGEDVDFSYRVSRKYNIIITPFARLIHTKSPTNRQSCIDWHRSAVVHRYYYVKKNLKKKRYVFAFWWSIVGLMMINCTRTFTKISRHYFKNTLGIILGVFDIATKNHYLLRKQEHK